MIETNYENLWVLSMTEQGSQVNHVSQETQWTVLALLDWTKGYLEKNDSESPRLDAEILLAHSMNCERIMLYTRFDEIVSETDRLQFRELVKQRASGCPVAYLVGFKEFYSLRFDVSEYVLIPRPETEFAVIAVLDIVKKYFSSDSSGQSIPCHVIDVGTGSGAIAITLATEMPQIQVTAVDLSTAALEVARKNATCHGVNDQIEFVEQDFLLGPSNNKFDIVVSNPPYVTSEEYEALSRNVREYEPQLALESGPTGMECYQRLVPQAAERLNDGGWLVLETSPMLMEQLKILVVENGFDEISIVSDLAGHPRIVTARRVNG
jgi:release factor glutamine methyltransferase